MGLNEVIEKVSDPYERQARLWPALLAILPIIVVISTLYASKVSVFTNLVMIFASCGGLYLMTNVCRDMGKRLETELFLKWGGKPTTQLLRHKDITIDNMTKRRYHALLSSKINEQFPNPEQETTDPSAADNVYQSAVRWMLDHTRDTQKFAILFKENISYGFRRNALGVKPIGMSLSAISFTWVLFNQKVLTLSPGHYLDLSKFAFLSEGAMASLFTSVAMLSLWVGFFTESGLRRAAFTYAEMLLRACDVLQTE